jgi:predicted RNA-binding Zn ribbon-like protein
LEILREFANTIDVERNIDELASPAEARAHLVAAGLPSTVSSDDDLARLLALRATIREILIANAGEADGRSAWAALEPFAAEAPLYVRPGQDPTLAPAGVGTAATIGALLGIVYDAVRDGTWRRLKLCRERTCAFAYYDASKNGSGTWCSMDVCGNRAKARRRREREKSGMTQSPDVRLSPGK